MNSHTYSFRVTVVDRLYTILQVCILKFTILRILKLKPQQLINTIELTINLICSTVSIYRSLHRISSMPERKNYFSC
jgi:hypothetical protein